MSSRIIHESASAVSDPGQLDDLNRARRQIGGVAGEVNRHGVAVSDVDRDGPDAGLHDVVVDVGKGELQG